MSLIDYIDDRKEKIKVLVNAKPIQDNPNKINKQVQLNRMREIVFIENKVKSSVEELNKRIKQESYREYKRDREIEIETVLQIIKEVLGESNEKVNL